MDCVKTLFKKVGEKEVNKVQQMKDYMLAFRFTGYKVYTVAWKDGNNQAELIRDYLSTRMGNSDFLKHITYKALPKAAKIFAAIKPSKGFDLKTVAALCKQPGSLYFEKTYKPWNRNELV